MSPKADAYNIVTERIIEALEAGCVPWHKPWKSSGLGPTSMTTGKAYRGINTWILALAQHAGGYSSPHWLTFKQAKARGGSVRKGEKGTAIVFWRTFTKTVSENGVEKEKTIPMLRYYTVFNVEQCDDVEAPALPELPEHDPIEDAETIARDYTAVEVKHGGDRAYYSPGLDYVAMPVVGAFDTAEHYYGTLFHELAHSTGHESRLGRKSLIQPTPFGTPDYSKEELIAEMAAAFLCGEAGIEVNVPHHAGYIASWLQVLKDDRKMLVQAAAAAQKASDYVLGIEYQNGSGEPSGSPIPAATK